MNEIFTTVERRTHLVVVVLVLITAALVVPFLAMAPDQSASTEPGGAVFDARDRIDERFVASVHFVGFIAEHESGDLLRAEPLTELLEAQKLLQADPEIGPTLFSYFNVDSGLDITGPSSIADLVQRELRDMGIDGVASASDAEVKEAAAALVGRFGVMSDVLGLSQQSTQNASGDWIVPAIFMRVVADDNVLGFGNLSVNLGGDTDVEEYDRDIQEVLRTASGWQVNGIAIDVNLTSQEQGAVAGPFIGFTVLAALLLVGLTFRSYWVLATVSVMFLTLLIWLKGISNLIGFKDDLVLSLIVPIAMVSFGVDFAFHAIGRYREERANGRGANLAVVTGMTAVSGALALAVTSDAAAFLANTTAGIESVVQFGIGAAIALFCAYLLLGIFAPFAVAHIEAHVPAPSPGRRSTALRVGGSLGAALMTMASVLFLVFLMPAVGVLLSVATAWLTLVIPLWIHHQGFEGVPVGAIDVSTQRSGLSEGIGRVVAGLAYRRSVVIPIAIAVTEVAVMFAVQVPARFDVEDFFSADTDFVQSLEQIDEHIGDRNGEPASLYIEGDLADPATLLGLKRRVAEIQRFESPAFARTDGEVDVYTGIFEVFDETWQSPVMASLVAQQTGVVLTDADADSIPDSRDQIEALIAVARETGVPLDQSRLAMTPDRVRTAVDLSDDGPDATHFELAIVNSRDQMSVRQARAALDPVAAAISTDLGGTFVQPTGSAFVRESSLEGVNRALVISLPIAVVACLLVATTFLRSLRFGLASIVPILMVVAWLYAFMELAGYAINLVTATIAAVSIGIGIDFALHYIARYREELDRHGRRLTAVRIAGEGTGLALVASAVSSAVGFGILALAPMPLFAAYGLLTALMVMMALVATLAVLPSLLVMITSDPR